MKNFYPLMLCGLVGALSVTTQAFAQGCGTDAVNDPPPLPIHSNQQNVAGDTCTAGPPADVDVLGHGYLPTYGGTGSDQREVIYSFTAQGADADISIEGTGGYNGTLPAVFLLPTCTASTDPIAFGFPGTPMHVGGLTDGHEYFVVVTANPGGPSDGCGQYSVNVDGTLPVGLTSFSVD